MTTEVPPVQGATRETDFVRATAEEVERREAPYFKDGMIVWPERMLNSPRIEVRPAPITSDDLEWARSEIRSRTEGR